MSRRVILETPRLRLTEWQPEDFPDFLAIHSGPEVMRYFIAGPYTPDYAQRRFDAFLDEQVEQGWTKWRLEDPATGRTVGRAGYGLADDGVSRELGYLLARDLWGRGLAQELARVLVKHHFRERSDDLLGFAHVENRASRRVLEKIGFTQVGEGDWHGKPHAFYRIQAGPGT